MKVLISYFYQIRFFKPNMIPLSTAMYDPKWFHKTQEKNDIFIDKNGVYNGLKIYPLVPKMYDENTDCSSGKCSNNPPHCQFLSNYRKQLDEINFNEFMEKIQVNCNSLLKKNNINEEPIIVFIVHEPPTKKCSERIVLMQWLQDNGIEVQEFAKEENQQLSLFNENPPA